LPSPETSRAMWRKSPPMGVKGCGASIMPSPGVKTRPLTMLNALVSGFPFCRPWSRWSLSHDPSICASTAFHIKHNEKTSKEEGRDNSGVIAQQRVITIMMVLRRDEEGKMSNGLPAQTCAGCRAVSHYSICVAVISRINTSCAAHEIATARSG
jgi:hypothetical protein